MIKPTIHKQAQSLGKRRREKEKKNFKSICPPENRISSVTITRVMFLEYSTFTIVNSDSGATCNPLTEVC